jgi:integrase
MMHASVYTVTDDQWQAAIRRDAKGLSSKYIRNVWGLISAAIFESTGRKPRVNLPAKEKNERPYLEPDQVTQFVKAIEGESIEIAALLALSSFRRSELKALTWDCVDFNRKTITVKGAMVYAGKESGMVHKRQNKTAASTRIIPIIPPLETALRLVENKEGYVVTFNGSYLYQRINEICEKSGLPKVGVHGLRHSFASLAYHLQIPEKIAMEIGGWADDGTMRKIYTHLAQKDIADRAKDFTNFFAK